MQGWAGYLDKLAHPYPTLPLYDWMQVAVATLETHPNDRAVR